MLKNRILPLCIVSSILTAQEVYKDIELFADNVEQNETKAVIKGGLLVSYDGKVMSAQEGIYDIEKKLLILKGNVVILDETGKKINAKELEVNLDNNNIKFHHFFEIDKDNIWISALNAIKESNNISLKNAIFSSCDVKNPDWKITFSKAIYNTKSKELKLSDAKIYINDLPIFYMPYLYLPLSKERRSGFLFPTFSYDKKEGFIYSQPYFWAIDKSQDLEIVPQIRTNRGYGIYATYRFVDTKQSNGKVKVGYFKDKSSFTRDNNLKYKEHYGVELYYKNNQVSQYLTNKGYESKLYINTAFFNDTDYFNLQLDDKITHHKIGSFYESRLNFFIKNSYFLAGVYFKYFKDTTQVSNSNTLQTLPKLQLHMPYTNILYKNVAISSDLSITNYTRESGTKALKVKLSVPLEIHFSLFNNFLNINITEELEATGYDFYNVPISQKKYSSTVLNTTVELSSEFVSIFDNGTLISMYSATFTKSKILNEHWMKYNEIPNELKTNFVDDIPYESKITFRTHQYWQNDNLNIDYLLEAHYYPKEGKFRDLNQEIDLKYKNWSFYSKIGYSFLHNQTTDIYNKFGYSTDKFGLFISALWKKDYLSLETLQKEVALSGYYNYSPDFKINAKIAYNIKDKNLKQWRVGTIYKRKCWSIDFQVGQDIRPVIKSDGSRGSISNNFVKVQLKVLPFGN